MTEFLPIVSLLCVPLAFAGGGWAFFGRDPRRLPFLMRAMSLLLLFNLLSAAFGVWQIFDVYAVDESGSLAIFESMADDPSVNAGILSMTLVYPIAGALASWLLALSLLFTYGRSKKTFEALSMMTVIHPCYVLVSAVTEMTGIFQDVAEMGDGVDSEALSTSLLAGVAGLRHDLMWSVGIALVLFVALRGLAWQPKESEA